MPAKGLHTIALISGGKDSFFSVLHCQRQGHHVVALANLHPGTDAASRLDACSSGGGSVDAAATPPDTAKVEVFEPGAELSSRGGACVDKVGLQDRVAVGDEAKQQEGDEGDEEDLNSFMYQTVGHKVIPLYARAAGLPLYRRGITGSAVQSAREYDGEAAAGEGTSREEEETESMTALLRAVIERHPEANAVCAGAILSTYQRTRVESVAVRLGLVPLAFLWKYPILPPPPPPAGDASSAAPAGAADDAQLLRDMAVTGLDARIIKVASAGLDEDFLWERISSERGIAKAKRALRHFSGGQGAILGEGGEFETLVVDGPPGLFRRRIVVDEGGRRVVREGGGCSWLSFSEARVEAKDGLDDDDVAGQAPVRVPDLLDAKFAAILEALKLEPTGVDDVPLCSPEPATLRKASEPTGLESLTLSSPEEHGAAGEIHWGCLADPKECGASIEQETESIVGRIRDHVEPHPLRCVTNTIILLRDMADFPRVNKVYGSLFPFINPPSRVTVSCGDLLPKGRNIAIYITAKLGLLPKERTGLHVQSRSYWAPANIGPYSQAVEAPVRSRRDEVDNNSPSSSLKLVSIAGQIPLVPATMELPEPSETSLHLQIVLSLQHLWRIGTEMQVQCWTSAVAYFPRAADRGSMSRGALLATKAWREAHAEAGDDEDEDISGPDAWDRRYNSEYMTFGDEATGPAALPDWEIFEDGLDIEPRREPPFFAVEVEELPRGAGIEWHAHAGLSGARAGAVRNGRCLGSSVVDGQKFHWQASYMLVKGDAGPFVHGIISIEQKSEGTEAIPCRNGPWLARALQTAWRDSVAKAGVERGGAEASSRPFLIYGVMGAGDNAWHDALSASPLIPCRSIWRADGRPAAAVALFRYFV